MFRNFVNSQNWNIGIVDKFSPEEFINKKSLPKIRWMQHNYKDRAFADPHIVEVTERKIIILCEELVFGEKGRISKLTISRPDFRLIDRKVLLQLSTHLSYPIILEKDGRLYIYPENSESGRITLYEYHTVNDKLEKVGIIVEEEATDFTICEYREEQRYFALSTKLHPDSQVNTYLYSSEHILGPYSQTNQGPVVTDRSCSRPGGCFFSVNENIYRPAQDCTHHYGRGLKIMKVESFIPFKESEQFEIWPDNFKYHIGIHTLNFKNNIAIVDGYGYLYPIIGRLLIPFNNIRRTIIKFLK